MKDIVEIHIHDYQIGEQRAQYFGDVNEPGEGRYRIYVRWDNILEIPPSQYDLMYDADAKPNKIKLSDSSTDTIEKAIRAVMGDCNIWWHAF